MGRAQLILSDAIPGLVVLDSIKKQAEPAAGGLSMYAGSHTHTHTHEATAGTLALGGSSDLGEKQR